MAKQGFEIVLIPENPLPATADNCSRIIVEGLRHELVESAFDLHLHEGQNLLYDLLNEGYIVHSDISQSLRWVPGCARWILFVIL